jgi:hypothetical protein
MHGRNGFRLVGCVSRSDFGARFVCRVELRP